MKKVILIKYGELTTKKDNRNMFIKVLTNNIREKLVNFDYEVISDYYRMFIVPNNEEQINEIYNILKKIFGIYEICIAYKIEDKSLDNIKKCILEVLEKKKFKSFKVITNRSDKTYEINSMDLSRQVGAYILKKIDKLKVDVHDPEVFVNIEIRKEAAYIYLNSDKSLGGYPVGSLGKGLLMLSGGIDSVVAGYLAMKRGVKLDFIYFESLPHTSLEARKKVIKLAKMLETFGNKGKLYIVNFTNIQQSIYKNMKSEYMITIMRRMMYRIAEKIAIRNKCTAIFNGESIGQVASQTLTSIKVVNEVTNYPIIRPLASFDKQEIIKISKEINTYDISILPYEDCCTIFVPPHPVINPVLKVAKEEEEKVDFNEMIKEAVKTVNIIKLNEEEKQNEYL